MYTITLGVDGMMCPMCEKHVNENIKKNYKIKKVTSSREDKKTVIITKSEIPEDELKKIIEESGYNMISYKIE